MSDRRSGYLARSDSQHASGFQFDRLAILQPAGADFRALQILQNADRPLQTARDTPQSLDAPRVLGMGSMGEVEARDIHPQAHQVGNTFLGIGSRANRADDFCAAEGLGILLGTGAAAVRSPATRSILRLLKSAVLFQS